MGAIQIAVIAMQILAFSQADKDWQARREARVKEWQATLRPLTIDEKLAAWLDYLDPRPVGEFTEFSDERLARSIVEEARSTFKVIFQPQANPFANGKRGPDRYSLAPSPGRRSLLLYTWKTYQYRFQLLESSNAVLLCVQPNTDSLPTKTGVPAARIAAIIEEMLSTKVVGKGEAAERFKLPDMLRAGQIFTNAERLGSSYIRDWKENVVGFLTNESLCLLVFKAWFPRAAVDLYPREEEWLPLFLYEKDGRSLVIERKWGKPYPRPARGGENAYPPPVPPVPPPAHKPDKDVRR